MNKWKNDGGMRLGTRLEKLILATTTLFMSTMHHSDGSPNAEEQFDCLRPIIIN